VVSTIQIENLSKISQEVIHQNFFRMTTFFEFVWSHRNQSRNRWLCA